MSEIKVSVNITLPGSVMFTQAEAEQLEKEKTGTGFDTKSMIVESKIWDKKLKKQVTKSERITFKYRKCRPAPMTISLSKEAYKYMRSAESVLSPFKPYQWKGLKPDARLKLHIKRLCEALGGLSYTYKVFDD